MCRGCLNSWRPPVVCGFLVAFALVPFGIDLTYEAYKEGSPIAETSATNSTSSVDIAKLYEGPAMISTGVFFAIIGLIFGARGYKRGKELAAEATLRAEREAWEMQQGPPLEFMPGAEVGKSSKPEEFRDPERANLPQSHPTPSTKPLTQISPDRRHVEGKSGNSDERELPDEHSQWDRQDRRLEVKPDEMPIAQSTPPGYMKGMDGAFLYVGSMSDLSTVGEVSIEAEADNFGFESDEASKKYYSRQHSSMERTRTNSEALRSSRRGNLQQEKAETQRGKVSSKITTQMQENIKSTSQSNASAKNDTNVHGGNMSSSVKFEDEKPTTISNTQLVGKSRDQRRKTRNGTSNGSDQRGSPRWGIELLSSPSRQREEQLARVHNIRQNTDSGCYDSEADSADIELIDRPSAPDPGHRRNTRDKSKAAAMKLPRKESRNYSNRSSTNVDYLEDRYYRERYHDSRAAYDDRYGYPIEDDSVFYGDSPELRGHVQQHEPAVSGRGRPEGRRAAKATTAQSSSGRQLYTDNSNGVLINARTLELKQDRHSSSKSSSPPTTTSRHRGSHRVRDKRRSSGSPRSLAEDNVGDRRRGDTTSQAAPRSQDIDKRSRRRRLPTPPLAVPSQRHRVRSDGSTPPSTRRTNAHRYTRQQSTISDVTSNKSKYYDEEISA